MVENRLTEALCGFIEEAVRDFSMQTESSTARAPRVVSGYLPPKRSRPEDDFPFVIVRPDAGTSEMGQTQVTVSIIIGCYTDGTDGYQYCLNVMNRIRHALCTMACQTLAKRYQLKFPISWENPSVQPYPQWQIDMTTHWTFNTPQLTDF